MPRSHSSVRQHHWDILTPQTEEALFVKICPPKVQKLLSLNEVGCVLINLALASHFR